MSSRRGVGPTLVVLIACAFSAGIHFALTPSHADESAALGAGFAVAGLLLLAFGLVVFMQPHSSAAALTTAVLLALLLAVYLLSRTAGLPGVGHGSEPFDALGLLTKLAELGALLASIHVYLENRSRPLPLPKTRSNPNTQVHPTPRLAFATLVATIAAVAGLAFAGLVGESATHAGAHDHASSSSASAQRSNAKALRLPDKMRKLWEDHIVWTRLAIVSFAADSPDLEPTVNRLLRNQDNIGDAIKPFYGRQAGEHLTALLKDHINGAVDVLVAAKSGDQQAFASANAAWYRNGRQIADFLRSANPRNWGRAAMRAMMRTHLDQTLSEASHQLSGDYRASIRDYDAVHHHILEMADALSAGIVAQFPSRFR